MALNRTIYFPNPTKAKTIGLSDTVRSDTYVYSTLYTVGGAETTRIAEGSFTIYGSNTSGVVNSGLVILDISGKEIVVISNQGIAGSATIDRTITLGELGLNNIQLATGDTIKIKYVYPNALGAYTSSIKATLLLEDFTA